jgi:hypothetical protein
VNAITPIRVVVDELPDEQLRAEAPPDSSSFRPMASSKASTTSEKQADAGRRVN